MLERDYILRILQEFTDALNLYLKKKKTVDLLDIDYSNLYISFFHQKREFFIEKTGEEIIEYMKQTYSKEEYPHRISMLSELFFTECEALNYGNEALCEKAKFLLQWIDSNSKTFSFERMGKIEKLNNAIA